MYKLTHARAAVACLILSAVGAARADLAPIASTPENDVLDAHTGLAWIKTATLQQGLDLGYRLATTSEAKALAYTATRVDDGVFALGIDQSNSVRANDYLSFANVVSIGHVAGPADQVSLAGYTFSTSTSITVPSPHLDPVTQTMVYPPSSTSTTTSNRMLVGELPLFADLAHSGVASSRFLNSDGTYGEGCLAGGCYPGNTLWDGVLGPANSEAAVGFFMVKSGIVPEPANVLMWALGLLGVSAAAWRRRP